IFLTGVSKFSGVSVFSALNNPNDLTLDKRYAAICGYTQEELETNFEEYINETADALGKTKSKLLADIKSWYNGYTWDGKTDVYNPFSTLMLFDKQEFSNYWIKTGASISTKMLLEDNDLLETLFSEKNIVDYKFFDGFNLNKIKAKSFLFQAGYLTIKSIDRIDDVNEYLLEIPNKEVRLSLTQYMLSAYSDIDEDNLSSIAREIKDQIKNLDAKGLEKTLRTLFAKIPYQLHISKEAYYHSMFLLIMNFLDFKVQGEVATNIGAIDALWKQPDMNVVIEIKYSTKKSKETLLKEAMKQIKTKKYYESSQNKSTILAAISFTPRKNKPRLTEIACKFEKL
ncbi:MAG: ATP-binding protein, partial [Elusimicrobiota bacterium]|nr:ATP-binding protein [Elusimicrobiota bacterium]